MPFKKKRGMRRRPIRRQRRYKKRYGNALTIPRIIRSAYNIATMESNTYNILPQNSSLSQTQFVKLFKFNEVNNYAHYANIFDQYRINLVVVKFEPIMTQIVNRPYDDSTTGNLVNAIPRYAVCIDRDDDDVQSFENIESRKHARVRLATKPITIAFRPSRLVPVYRIGATNAYKVDNSKQYCDMAYPDILHYGVKFALEASSPSAAYAFRVTTKYYVSLADRRN